MEKSSYKLVGAPCGQHGQYTFYKALRIIDSKREQILAIGDFFFVRIWPDSELVSIGELQLLWTDRVSEQTLVSLRLYFLPENTPMGRNNHGEHEVLALNEKVVLRADDLLSWICEGKGWRCGLRAVWRGACAPPANPPSDTSPLHQTKLDFSDVAKEKSAIEIEPDTPGVVVFSYPRYCRYRALLARLEGMQSAWLRDSLVAALGGYAADTTNTTILYCKDTFEYPELEGHEFVCNHLAPRLKGRPRGRRKRAQRSRSHTPSSVSESSDKETKEVKHVTDHKVSPRRLSLRNGACEASPTEDLKHSPADQRFLEELAAFHKERGDTAPLIHTHLSLRGIYASVTAKGGYETVSKNKLWRAIHPERPARVRSIYERFLLPYENHMRRSRANGAIDEPDTISVPDSPHTDQLNIKSKEEPKQEESARSAEELNREFLESLPKEEKPLICVKPPQLLIDPDKQKQNVIKLFEENNGLVAELSAKYSVRDSVVLGELGGKLSARSELLLTELASRLHAANTDTSFLKEIAKNQEGSNALTNLSTLGDKYTVNGHTPNGAEQKSSRPLGRSSLRAVRVKPTRPSHSNTNTPPMGPLRPDSGSGSPSPSLGSRAPPPAPPPAHAPLTNFGINPPLPTPHSDDEIVEVPYKPKTPEIIDLDEYPESPQSTKKKKLDILKERGLEVTAIPPTWPTVAPLPLAPINPPLMLNPAMQHQIMTQASLFQMYNIIPQNYANGIQPPKIIQSSCLYGSMGPEKTVYGNPKDPFMPPPHILQGTPIKPQKAVTTEKVDTTPSRQDILDLTCKTSTPNQKPSVEIVRVPNVPSPSKSTAQNLSKNYTLIDGKAVVGSNLEITLVNPKSQTPPKNRQPQKRSSNGKFVSTKTPTPPKEYPKDYPKNYPSPSGAKLSPTVKKNPINIPTYQISKDDISPTSSTGSRDSQQNNLLQNVFKGQNSLAQIMEMQKCQMPNLPHNLQNLPQNLPNLPQMLEMQNLQKSVPMSPFSMDPMYMSALYSSLAGQVDQRQLAMYRDLMATQFRYSGLLGGVATPTTKN